MTELCPLDEWLDDLEARLTVLDSDPSAVQRNFPRNFIARIDSLTTYKNNARTHSDAQVAQIAASIAESEGTLPKSQMLVRLHPDVARLTWKFGRWHHQVDYGPFRANKLVRAPEAEISEGPNNYGMRLVQVTQNDTPSTVTQITGAASGFP